MNISKDLVPLPSERICFNAVKAFFVDRESVCYGPYGRIEGKREEKRNQNCEKTVLLSSIVTPKLKIKTAFLREEPRDCVPGLGTQKKCIVAYIYLAKKR